jgi:acid stress-induced BolA-like protein IbaG/YrbA
MEKILEHLTQEEIFELIENKLNLKLHVMLTTKEKVEKVTKGLSEDMKRRAVHHITGQLFTSRNWNRDGFMYDGVFFSNDEYDAVHDMCIPRTAALGN